MEGARELVPNNAPVVAEWGTVGWDNSADYASTGKSAADGMAVVKVQLYSGRKPGTARAIKAGTASGQRVRCLIGAPLTMIPTFGSRVLVIFPRGDTVTECNGVIVTVVAPSPQRLSTGRAVLGTGTEDLDITPANRATVGVASSAGAVALATLLQPILNALATFMSTSAQAVIPQAAEIKASALTFLAALSLTAAPPPGTPVAAPNVAATALFSS